MTAERDTRTPRIAVVGSTNLDLITYSRRVPDAGETLVGDRFTTDFGGKGANQAVMARLMGAEVCMVNRLGNDPYGEMILDNFASFGIDTTAVERVATSTGVASIWVEPDGTNRIIIVPGANHDLSAADAAAAIREMPTPDVVVGQFEIPQEVTAAAFTAARAVAAVTILNPAPGAVPHPDLLAVTDWLIPNEVEFALIAGSDPTDAAMSEYAGSSDTRLIVTLGSAGAALVTADGRVVRVPAPVVTAVDTTGAGDAFVGAFTYGLAAGLSDLVAVRLGTLVSSDSVTRPGTQASFPRSDRCAGFLTQIS